jgi:hypothetical protein
MTIPEWEEVGIPVGYGPYRLLYNPPTGIVVAELRSIGDQFLPNQTYIRQKDSPRYEPLRDIEPMLSCESVVTSLRAPMLFYLSNKFTKREGGYSGDLEGLYSFNLQRRTSQQLATRDTLSFPPPYTEGWVTNLVDASADASELYLTVGMMRPHTSAGFRTVNHQLARMDLPTCKLHLISHLKGVFF